MTDKKQDIQESTEVASAANNCYIFGWAKRWYHKLFKCPTFWKLKSSFTCPKCGEKYRCYWDGNDIAGVGIDYCNSCALGGKNITQEYVDYRKLCKS